MSEQTQHVQVEVRSAPKFLTFAVFGAVIGVVAAAVITLVSGGGTSSEESGVRQVSTLQAFGLLALALAAAGAVLALAAALIAERVLRSRTSVALAVHEVVEPDAGESAPVGGVSAAEGETIDLPQHDDDRPAEATADRPSSDKE
ncbi:hypothetical protein [Pseudoclavibacter soli]|uniref:hypothetical protein n=1 Tax=Pseudoclavibacter soli TaxID=452623 RepID=UPI0004253E62|nr:hypothetical protein [Pseudoclavibacter soli]